MSGKPEFIGPKSDGYEPWKRDPIKESLEQQRSAVKVIIERVNARLRFLQTAFASRGNQPMSVDFLRQILEVEADEDFVEDITNDLNYVSYNLYSEDRGIESAAQFIVRETLFQNDSRPSEAGMYVAAKKLADFFEVIEDAELISLLEGAFMSPEKSSIKYELKKDPQVKQALQEMWLALLQGKKVEVTGIETVRQVVMEPSPYFTAYEIEAITWRIR